MSTDRPDPILGEVIFATQVTTSSPSPSRIRAIILLLAASVALMMTGFGIIMPVFARRLDEFDSAVQALGLMTMSFALAQFLASPFMGSLSDQLGRRPLILGALAAFAAANIGFLFAPSPEIFMVVRALEGALTAGLFPSAMGVVADIVPENKRAQSVGIVMGGYGAGFIVGPVIGGVLYDGWGFEAPFVASAAIAFIAFVAAAIMVPETRTREGRRREKLGQTRVDVSAHAQEGSFWDSLPRPLYVFAMLMLLDFIVIFAFSFAEPQMVFYFYDQLNWTTIRFGLVVGVFGLAMVLGQGVLGQSSDRFGRKPVIIVGMFLGTTLYLGLVFVTWFPLMILVAVVAGLGAALVAPALSAFYIDITAEQLRSRIVGIKASATSLGGVAGPLLVVAASALITPRGVFVIAAVVMVVTAVLALVVLREPRHVAEEIGDVALDSSAKRALAAQATFRGIAVSARTARITRTATL